MEFRRDAHLEALRSGRFDLLVVGGGITGLGVALDAASRGLSVALVERDDFSSGTSSKSSKLAHGGLRYLQQGEVRLVYEALHERQRMLRNAPHLVQVMPFMIPILTKDGVISKKIARALGSALWMYDLTGGWRIGKLHRRLRAREAHAHFPTMPAEKLSSGYLYYDATVDDSRLCIAVARTAAELGATIVNRCGVTTITHDANGKANGARVRTLEGEEFTVSATSIVNAGGVWADEVRTADEGRDPHSIRPAKGVHITIPWEKARNDIAVVIPVRRDRRSLFVVPWIKNPDGSYRYTYVGTTDTDFAGDVDESQCSVDDIDYILEALNQSITTNVTRDDVTAVWSGLRPLVRQADGSPTSDKTADLSRNHKVAVSTSGVVSITGGKLTTFRKMAEHTVDEVCARLGRRTKSKSTRLALIGGRDFDRSLLEGPHAHLAQRYGTELDRVLAIASESPAFSRPLVDGLPYLAAEAIFAVRHEMALSLDDVLSRRTRARIVDRRAALASARQVAELIAPELGWTPQDVEAQVREFVDSCAREEAAGVVSEAEYLASTRQD